MEERRGGFDMNDRERQGIIAANKAFEDTRYVPTPYIDNFGGRGIIILDLDDKRQRRVYDRFELRIYRFRK